MSDIDEPHDVTNPGPSRSLSVDADLETLAVEVADALNRATSPDERVGIHRRAGKLASTAVKLNHSGRSFARAWIRRLGDDMASQSLAASLPDDVETSAQTVVRELFELCRDDLVALRRGMAPGANPLDFVRSHPRAAGVLRDLGRIAQSLRGTGVLTFEDPELIVALVRFDDALRSAGNSGFTAVPEVLRITRKDLLRWADEGNGYELPALIERLIAETTYGVEVNHFPAGVGASSGGWDGTVRAETGNTYLPDGLSVWELSVEKNSSRKAESDYGKRLALPDGSPTRAATYVQLICRPWINADRFAAAHSAEGRWRSVRGYNVDHLEAWLAQAPSTTVWFSSILGRPIEGLQTADEWWESWLRSTTPPLEAAVVLAGRADEAGRLAERMSQPGVTTIGGDIRAEEIKAFVVAAALDRHAQRLLLARRRDEAIAIIGHSSGIALLLPGLQLLHDLPAPKGNHLIVPVPGASRADVVLPPVAPDAVREALERAGVSFRQADDLARLARRSLPALRRRLSRSPELHRPSWADESPDVVVRRALLANSWNEARADDRAAIATLMNLSYGKVEERLRRLAAAPDDAMIAVLDERWHVISPADAWLLLGQRLTATDLSALRSLARTVLLEPDPFQGMTEVRRLQASIAGTARRYSAELTRGVCHSLAQLGAFGYLVRADGRNGEQLASEIVRELLETANADPLGSVWRLLVPHLPLLAEAAPQCFIDAVRVGLHENHPFRAAVFGADPTEFGFSTSAPIIHVLWALETLAWEPDYLADVTSLLAQLAAVDPGGRNSTNSPMASLVSVFYPLRPNTVASLQQRLELLHGLRRRHPDVAWELLLSMIPTPFSMLMTTEGPRYREWKRGEVTVSRADFEAALNDVTAALVEDANADPDRWLALIKQFDHLQPLDRRRVREGLTNFAHSIEPKSREALWNELRSLVAKHREYGDAFWALPEEELSPLETISVSLAPTAPSLQHHWLFTNGLVELGDRRRRDDFTAYDAEVARRRDVAVAEILGDEGIAGLAQFALGCEAPGEVGAALARVSAGEFDLVQLQGLGEEIGPGVDFAFGYFSQRFRASGWSYLDRLIEDGRDARPVALARLLQSTWRPLEAGERAERLGDAVGLAYWTTVSLIGLGGGPEDAIEMSARLVAIGRPAAALDLLALRARQASSLAYADAVVRAFEALMSVGDDPEAARLSQYDIHSLLAIVAEHRQQVGLDRAARIEWFYLALLGPDPDAPTLHAELRRNPSLFADLITMIFRPESEADGEPPTEEQKRAGENAFRLLRSWATCPGSDESGHVRLEALRSWVTTARQLLSERQRTRVGDAYIGEALAAAPEGADGYPPEESVRDLLEELANDTIDHGLELRLLNNRGVTTRSLDEGGKQEWELASTYRMYASAFGGSWPRSAAIFRRLADHYEAHARHEDAAAERRRRGLDR